jgi:hypothetical protein
MHSSQSDNRRMGWLAAVALVLVTASAASAQSFPDAGWTPLRCQTTVMTDPYADESGAQNDRDIVGDLTDAAGYRTSDGTYLYLRMRVDSDPIPGGTIRPFAWGLLIDTDGNTGTYEALIVANGVQQQVALHRNTTTTLVNDPTDPPDAPAFRTYDVATHARSVVAPNTDYGGNADYFIDFAVPWSDLQAMGISATLPVTAWAATSSTSSALNGDFACFDNGTGNPTLSGTAPARTILDPGRDTDDDGYSDDLEIEQGTDPNDAGSHPSGGPNIPLLQGGGGCTAAPTGLMTVVTLGLIAAWLHRRRRGGFN